MKSKFFPKKSEVTPKVYAYQLPNDSSKKGQLKIGQTNRSVLARVTEQVGATRAAFNIVLEENAMQNDGSTFSDHDIHNYLRNKGFYNSEGEWFECTVEDISAAIKTHKGVVTSLAGAEDNYSFFQTDAVINSGNSGGPIINQKGNIVGIAFASWVEEGVQGIHFGIKSSILKTFASANGLKFLIPNNRVLSNKELGELITESTVYIECHMTIAKINKMIAEMRNEKSFFRKYKKK